MANPQILRSPTAPTDNVDTDMLHPQQPPTPTGPKPDTDTKTVSGDGPHQVAPNVTVIMQTPDRAVMAAEAVAEGLALGLDQATVAGGIYKDMFGNLVNGNGAIVSKDGTPVKAT